MLQSQTRGCSVWKGGSKYWHSDVAGAGGLTSTRHTTPSGKVLKVRRVQFLTESSYFLQQLNINTVIKYFKTFQISVYLRLRSWICGHVTLSASFLCVCTYVGVCVCSLMRITSVYKSSVQNKHDDFVHKLRFPFLNNRPQFVCVPTQIVSKHSRRSSETVVKSDPFVKHQHGPLFVKITIIAQ